MKELLHFAAVVAIMVSIALSAAGAILLVRRAPRQDYAPGDVPERMSATDPAGLQ